MQQTTTVPDPADTRPAIQRLIEGLGDIWGTDFTAMTVPKILNAIRENTETLAHEAGAGVDARLSLSELFRPGATGLAWTQVIAAARAYVDSSAKAHNELRAMFDLGSPNTVGWNATVGAIGRARDEAQDRIEAAHRDAAAAEARAVELAESLVRVVGVTERELDAAAVGQGIQADLMGPPDVVMAYERGASDARDTLLAQLAGAVAVAWEISPESVGVGYMSGIVAALTAVHDGGVPR